MAAVDPRIEALATAQAGVVSRQQMLELGLSPSAATRRAAGWRTLTTGIYLTTLPPARGILEPTWDDGFLLTPEHFGHPLDEPTPWLAKAWAGALVGGPGAALASASAGYLHGWSPDPPAIIEVMLPEESRRAGRPGWRFVRRSNGPRDAPVGAPPRTSPVDTLIDVAQRSRTDGDAIGWITRAVQRGVDVQSVLCRVHEREKVARRSILLGVLADAAGGSHSYLEHLWVTTVERPHGLPPMVRQLVVPGSGRVADGGWPEARLLLELDGRRFHEGRQRFRDLDRDNGHTALDWATLRYGYHDTLTRPCRCARQVAEALTARGVPVDFRRCRRC